LELLNSILRRVRQRAFVILNPRDIAGVDKAAANPATEIMLSLANATPVGALAEHRPARSRLIDWHDRCHLEPPEYCHRPATREWRQCLRLYTSHGPVGSVSQPCPVEPRETPSQKNQAPDFSEARSLHGARGTSARAAISLYVVMTTAAVKLLAVAPREACASPA
jgi:hypothetical protein